MPRPPAAFVLPTLRETERSYHPTGRPWTEGRPGRLAGVAATRTDFSEQLLCMPPATRGGGKRRAPPEPDASDATTQAVEKRFKTAIDESVSHLMCAITYDLPVDPVTAEDGNIYERSAIENWLCRKETSPRTNQPMGTQLLPAKQVRAMIESLVKAEALPAEKIAAWQARIKEQEEVAELERSAAAGDVSAMIELSSLLFNGERGCKIDKVESFRLVERAAKLGSVDGLGRLGVRYLQGGGVMKDEAMGLMLITEAAALGLLGSCYRLGVMHAEGKHGVPLDFSLARKWFQRAVRSGDKDPSLLERDSTAKTRYEHAVEWLRSHQPGRNVQTWSYPWSTVDY